MVYEKTTHVPNVIFDRLLPILTESELKIILIVIRQTVGWVDRRTGRRKERDRISGSQFRAKTGLSKRIIAIATQSLIEKQLLEVSGFKNNVLRYPCDRKGKAHLFYRATIPAHILPFGSAKSSPKPGQNCDHNKTNAPKLSRTKETSSAPFHIGELISRKPLYRSIEKADK